MSRPIALDPAATASSSVPMRTATLMFLSFAFAYFFSALVRGVTATLAPEFSAELDLNAGDLGLLAGAYFFGFAFMQLPLGGALDRFGPRRVLLVFIAVAVLGCAAFALARSFLGLTVARALIGVGVSACLMAPMTTFRRSFGATAQMRANSWMLMTGSLGMVASTLPVQWLLPLVGWRALFWALALLFAVAIATIAWLVPSDAPAPSSSRRSDGALAGYGGVFRHPTFRRFAPMAFFQYGGMVAVQSLWAGPWMVQVCGFTAQQAARGLFGINVAMLLSFMSWGVVVPRLYARGWTAQRLIARGTPLCLAVLATAVLLGSGATAWAWGAFCVSSTVVSLSQPAVAQAFPTALAGRALSAYNLLIFVGVFLLQWGIGLAIDGFKALGWGIESSFQGAFALLTLCCVASYVWFLRGDDRTAPGAP
ncbi:MFS transporter [Piscinibacter sp. XHJ-5]|uniref:MFS transporter n=1 Tax=Piscinibacter sp. XHJ-5 TaxID=3037797 RepID=UPI00245287F4|nr:MFS transporter [Piscinibacter sp. XHJ-5]